MISQAKKKKRLTLSKFFFWLLIFINLSSYLVPDYILPFGTIKTKNPKGLWPSIMGVDKLNSNVKREELHTITTTV